MSSQEFGVKINQAHFKQMVFKQMDYQTCLLAKPVWPKIFTRSTLYDFKLIFQ